LAGGPIAWTSQR
jgi:hypothetical protein